MLGCGSHGWVGLPPDSLDPAARGLDHGRQVPAIQRAKSLLVGMITEVTDVTARRATGLSATARLDLLGEIKQRDTARRYFQRGVTEYPVIGDPAALITRDELRLIYDMAGADTINIGQLQQDSSIGACIKVDDMLSKHFALFGTTGVGKSSGVALSSCSQILRGAAGPAHLPARPAQRIRPLLRRPGARCSTRAT